MPKHGSRPDLKRRAEAARLRAQGLTLLEIGRRMGVTKQNAQHLLRAAGVDTSRRVPVLVRCHRCGEPVCPRPLPLMNNGNVLCKACLAKAPESRFRVRLKTFRVAAGLSQGDLAEALGTERQMISGYEQGKGKPHWRTLGKLARVLGLGLIDVEDRS